MGLIVGWCGKAYSNVLAIVLLVGPELVSFFAAEVALLHRDINQSFFDALAHALATTADEDAAVECIDDEPDNVGLHADFILDVLGLGLTADARLAALYDLLDLALVVTKLARIELVQHGIADALDQPDLVGTVRVLEPVEDEASEGSHAYASADEDHGAFTTKLFGQRISHETAEHWHAKVKNFARIDAFLLSSYELLGQALHEATTNTCAGSTGCVPIRGLVDSDSHFDQAARARQSTLR